MTTPWEYLSPSRLGRGLGEWYEALREWEEGRYSVFGGGEIISPEGRARQRALPTCCRLSHLYYLVLPSVFTCCSTVCPDLSYFRLSLLSFAILNFKFL
jgi:hypothetical protein